MQFKSFLLLFILIIFSLFLLGCVSVPTCGDGVCSNEEQDPSSSYFCTSDCGKEINQINKTVYTCPACKEWDYSQNQCVWQCASNESCCGEDTCYDPLLESCCVDENDVGIVESPAGLSCCSDSPPEFYDAQTQSCCIDYDGSALIFDGANLTCCEFCPDDSDDACSAPTTSSRNSTEQPSLTSTQLIRDLEKIMFDENKKEEFEEGIKLLNQIVKKERKNEVIVKSSTAVDPYDPSNCDAPGNNCPSVEILCLDDPTFCQWYPNAGGVCIAEWCRIDLKSNTCNSIFGYAYPPLTPPNVRIIAMLPTYSIPNPTIDAECTLLHELSHVQDGCDCPNCGSEVKAYNVSYECEKKVFENFEANHPNPTNSEKMVLQDLEYAFESQKFLSEYSACLCEGKRFGKNEQYVNGTCNTCKNELLNKLLDLEHELFEKYLITLGRPSPGIVDNANVLYCEAFEEVTY